MTEVIEIRQGFRYVLGRGTISCGYYVTNDQGKVLSGPYTNKPQAQACADEMTAVANLGYSVKVPA